MNADMAKKNPKDNLNAGSFSRAASTREFPNRSLNRNCLVRSMPYLAATCTMVNKGLEKHLRLDLPEPTRPKLPVGVPMSLKIRISQGHSEILKKKERCQSVTCSKTCHESSRGGLVISHLPVILPPDSCLMTSGSSRSLLGGAVVAASRVEG